MTLMKRTDVSVVALVSGALVSGSLLVASAVPAAAAKCTRLPLSDIAFGKAETIKQANVRLDEYAERVAKKRGWSGPLSKSNRTSKCAVYLNLGPFGTEYKCLVTATYCAK